MTTVAARTESVVRDAVGELMKAAGFRRKRLVFRRVHGELVQVVQVHVRVTVSGGSKPAEGFFRIWIGLGPSRLAPKEPLEFECGDHIELHAGIPSPRYTWEVPPTRGAKRAKVAADLVQAFEAMLATLDQITDDTQVKALVAEATQNRIWQRQPLAWPKKHPAKTG